MARISGHLVVLYILLLTISVAYSEKSQSSQAQTLLRLQSLLNYPPLLSSWNNHTDFCSTEPSQTVTVVCYGDSITQLHIIGVKGTQSLPKNFSIDSFFTTLVKLPSLKVLTLVSLGLHGPLPGKISRLSSLEIINLSSNFINGGIPKEIVSLTNLQSLIVDDNLLSRRIPDSIGSLSALTVLSVKNNFLNGTLPKTLGRLENLRVLALSHNNFSGEVPDLTSMENLQILNVEENLLGPRFPIVTSKIVSIVLSRNKFRSAVPDQVQSWYKLEHFDISGNRFVGPFPTSLLSLPSIKYLNISLNKLTGMLLENLPCNGELEVADLSSNLLTGEFPSCLKHKVVKYYKNCLATRDKTQHAIPYCRNEALAVGMLPHRKRKFTKTIVILTVTIGILVLGVIFFVLRKFLPRKTARKPVTRLILENASTSYTSKLFSDARYISQAMKLGALALPAYRTFSLEELEEATKNFDTSSFIGEGPGEQIYGGQLKDGSHIAVRCLKMKRSQSTQNFMRYLELISRLRHHHLASALGHCFECYLEDSSVSRIFLVFEYVPNGNLRSLISEKHARRTLTWTQRISAAIGIAKGIQFLHTGIVPGVFSNNLKTTDILLDQSLVAKISSYNLPLIAEFAGKDGVYNSSAGSKDPKFDIYDFGVILLELITGKAIYLEHELHVLKDQLQVSITADDPSRKSVVDRSIRNTCSDESVKTMIEVCWRCLIKEAEDRPSVEDILWNLQYAAQVQGARKMDSRSNESSPISPIRPKNIKLTVHEK